MTTWNPSDKSANITLTNSNLTATLSVSSANGVRSTTSNSSGKWYFEITATNISASTFRVGFANATQSLTALFGASANSGAYIANNGNFDINASVIGSSASWTTGAVLRIAVDFTNKLVWLAVGGGNWNNSGTANPATGTGGFSLSTLSAGPYFIGFSGNANTNAATMDPTGAAFGPPSGFSTWDVSGVSVAGLTAIMARGLAAGAYSFAAAARGSAMSAGRGTGSYAVALSARGTAQAGGKAGAGFAVALAGRAAAMGRGKAGASFGVALLGRSSVAGKGKAAGSFAAALFGRSSIASTGRANGAFAALLAARLLAAFKGLAKTGTPVVPFDPDFALLAPARAELFLAPGRNEAFIAPALTETLLAE